MRPNPEKIMFRKYILTFFTSALLTMASSAQDIDTPERTILNKNKPDIHRVDSLNILSRDLLFINPIRAAQLASEALRTSLKINYPIGQAYAYRILSSIYSNNDLDIIGTEYVHRALIIFQTYGDSAGIANCYITMGHAFRRSQNRKEEVEYHKKSFEIFSRLKIAERIAVSAHNLGESYFITGEFQKSRELTRYAIKINDSLQNLPVLSNCYKVMGKLEFAQGNFEQAENYFKRVLAISDKLGPASQKIATVESMIALASVYGQKEHRRLQLSFLKDAAAFSEKQLLPDYLQTIYTALIKYYASEKNQQQVLKYITEYNTVSESVASKVFKNQTELGQYAIQVYQFHENEKFELEKQNIIKANRIKTQNLFLLITLIFGVILIGQIIILLKSVRKQKKTKQQIIESEEKFRGLVEQSLTGIYIIQDEKFTYINPRFARIFGYEQNEMLGMENAGEIVYESDRGMVRDTVLQRLEGKEVSSNYNFRGVKKDGTVINVEVFGAKAMQSGKPITIGTLLDITESKIAEKAIKESEEKYRSLIEQASDSIVTADEKGNFTEVNSSFCKLLDYSHADLLNRNIATLMDPEQLKSDPLRFDLLRQGHTILRERRMLHRDGTFIEVEVNVKMLTGGRIICIFRDIRERKKAEKELRASEETRRLIMNSAIDAIVGMDINGLVTIWTPQAEKIFGWKEEDVVGKKLSETIIPHQYREAHQRGLAHYMQTGKGPVLRKIIEISALRNDGEEFPIELAIVPVKQGESKFFCAFIRDITERKKAEKALRQSEEKYRSLIEQASVPIITYSLEGTIHEFNKSTCDMSGYSPDEFAQLRLNDLLIGDIVVNKKNQDALLEGNVITIYRQIRKKDGTKLDVEFVARLLEDNKILAFGRDITERKKAEQALAESENRLRTIYDTEPECIKLLGPNGELQEMNPAGLAMIEADNLELVKGHSVLGIVAPEYRDAFANLTKEVFKGKQGKLGFEIIGLKGNRRWLETHAVPLKNAEGKIVSLLGVTRDVTEKKKAEEQIIKEKELSESIISNLPDVFYLFNKEGRFLRWNKNLEKVLGYSKKEIAGITLFDLFENSNRKPLLEKLKEIVETGKVEFEGNFLPKEGKKIPYFFKGWRIHYEGNSCIIGIGVDMTNKIIAEELLKKSYEDIRRLVSHLEQVREEERIAIAREIHDELGQQLTVLKMDINWLNDKLAVKEEKVQHKMNDLLEVIDNTVNAVRRISSELRPSILDDLGLLTALEWHGQEFEKRSGVKTKFKTDVMELNLPVNMSTSLFRIFQESLTNIARHAKATKVEASLSMKKNELIMTIRDDGEGFDPKTIVNKKTLGILGMRERTNIMGGEYAIESKPGKGTITKVKIPVNNQP